MNAHARKEITRSLHFVLVLVEAERKRGCGRLVDDAQHVETGDLAGVLRGLRTKKI